MWPTSCNICILFLLCPAALGQVGGHRDWRISDVTQQSHSSVRHWGRSCSTYKLVILFMSKQIFKLGLEDKPNKRECSLKLDPTTPASGLRMSKVTDFILCGRYEATKSWSNCRFPYGKVPCLKRASKGKDKKIQNHVEGKGNNYLEQIWLQGSSESEPQSGTGWGFCPRCLHLALIPSALQAALFVCYYPHTFLWLLCSFLALQDSFLIGTEEHLDANMKPEVSTHADWKKAESVRRKKCETEELHHTTNLLFIILW